ncbi:MAG: glycosyltransferase family 4 protein [Solirubrobacterales bacterium]
MTKPLALGFLDTPAAGDTVHPGALTVSGWALFDGLPASRVEVFLGDHRLGRALTGIDRADVAAVHEGPGAAVSGFSLTVDLDEGRPAPGPTRVHALATGVDGTRLELAHPVRLAAGADPEPEPAPPRTAPLASGPRRGLRTLVCTHQLCLGGASQYLAETLAALRRLGAIDPVVISPIGGPLRERLEALGIPVHVSGPAPLHDLEAHDGRVAEISAWAATQGFELALVNTASPLTLAGAEAAAVVGLPGIWVTHETYPPAVLWAGCGPGFEPRLGAALGWADRVIFQAGESAALFAPLVSEERRLTLPYGIDLERIDASRAALDRVAERRRLGLPLDADLLVCLGTVEPRKAQAALVQAFDLVADQHPRAHLALVGGVDTGHSAAVASWASACRSAGRIAVVPTTPDVHSWLGAADLLVCSSRIETLPRAVVEGMAFELPVLATAISGLRELIDDGVDGWLCEPGDTVALAAGLRRALAAGPGERRRIGRAGRDLVERRHEVGAYARRLAAVLQEAARRPAPGGGPQLGPPASVG